MAHLCGFGRVWDNGEISEWHFCIFSIVWIFKAGELKAKSFQSLDFFWEVPRSIWGEKPWGSEPCGDLAGLEVSLYPCHCDQNHKRMKMSVPECLSKVKGKHALCRMKEKVQSSCRPSVVSWACGQSSRHWFFRHLLKERTCVCLKVGRKVWGGCQRVEGRKTALPVRQRAFQICTGLEEFLLGFSRGSLRSGTGLLQNYIFWNPRRLWFECQIVWWPD